MDDKNMEQLRSSARLQVQKAIEKLPLKCKEAYIEAMEMAPVLCATESDPLKFLRRCDYKVDEAAKRLCLYWTERKRLFQDRAFFPLIITGDGALTKDDVLCLKSGWPALLPDTTSGQRVLLLDRRQFHPVSTAESRQRCAFYIAKIMAEEERTQTEKGILLITLITVPRAPEVQPDFAEQALKLVRDVFPVKCFFHLVNLTGAAGGADKRYEVQDRMEASINRHLSSGSKLDDVEVHFERGSGEEEILAELLGMGLALDGIPTYLGGNWTLVKHTEWCQQQARSERKDQGMMIKPQPTKNTKDTASTDKKKSAEARRQRQRELNLIYSRRKRERRQKELQDLQDEHDQLSAEKDYLLEEQRRLEDLLAKAAQELEKDSKGASAKS